MTDLINIEQIHNRRNLKDMVYQVLKQRILHGEYEPGEQLLIDNLVREFKVSRTPIKEAINQLDAGGLVDIFSQRGTFITQVSAKDIQDIFDVRKILESFALERLINNLDENDKVELRKWLEVPDPKLTADRKALKLYDLNFHKYLISASQNNDLIRIYDMLFTKIQLVITAPTQVNEIVLWIQEHGAIIENILKKDITKAKEALLQHLDQACRRLIQA